jgi:hypothetical protein
MRPFFLFLLVACGGSDPEVSTPNPDPSPANQGAEGPAPEANTALSFDKAAALAKADLADGTEDKVIQKCAGCSLAMDGDAAHSIDHEGYSLHMCSIECKTNVEADLDGTLAKLN